MAFNRDNSAHKLALRAEVEGDPKVLGLPNMKDDTNLLMATMNDRSKGGSTVQRPINELTVLEIAAVINGAEFGALDAYDKVWVEMFINQPRDVALADFKPKFLAVFDAVSATRIAALALQDRPGSRAEILFDVNTVLVGMDWAVSRNFV